LGQSSNAVSGILRKLFERGEIIRKRFKINWFFVHKYKIK